jgi:hypothetical protein
MTEEEAIRYLARTIGEMELFCGNCNFRLMLTCGFPVYGKTLDDVLKNAIIVQFGEDFVTVANDMKVVEEISRRDFVRLTKKRFPSLFDPQWLNDGEIERIIELCHTGK